MKQKRIPRPRLRVTPTPVSPRVASSSVVAPPSAAAVDEKASEPIYVATAVSTTRSNRIIRVVRRILEYEATSVMIPMIAFAAQILGTLIGISTFLSGMAATNEFLSYVLLFLPLLAIVGLTSAVMSFRVRGLRLITVLGVLTNVVYLIFFGLLLLIFFFHPELQVTRQAKSRHSLGVTVQVPSFDDTP